MVPQIRVQTHVEGKGKFGAAKSMPSSRKGTRVEVSDDAAGLSFNNYQDPDVSTNNNDNVENQNNMSLHDFPQFTQTKNLGSM